VGTCFTRGLHHASTLSTFSASPRRITALLVNA
jgi:hypothetical protein